MKNKLSNFIILISLINIIILLIIKHFYKEAVKEKIYHDTLIVNQLGQIRGNIQRYVKLKLITDKREYISKKEIDNTFKNLLKTFKENTFLLQSYQEDFIFRTTLLQNIWEKIKQTKDKNKLIFLSENAWTRSNNLISKYEQIHKIKFKKLTLSIDIAIYSAIIFIIITIFIIHKKIKKGLEIEVIKDKLTETYNRRFFDEQSQYLTEKFYKHKTPFSMIIIDIDNFKKINDTYGHKIGDNVLKQVGNIIKHSIRKNDLAFRYGGEEFVILLPDTYIKEAFFIAERIRNNISKKVKILNTHVTVSGGVGEFQSNESFKDFFKRVDNALYKAKKSGKNKIIIAD